jgi:hypothetical protein
MHLGAPKGLFKASTFFHKVKKLDFNALSGSFERRLHRSKDSSSHAPTFFPSVFEGMRFPFHFYFSAPIHLG